MNVTDTQTDRRRKDTAQRHRPRLCRASHGEDDSNWFYLFPTRAVCMYANR